MLKLYFQDRFQAHPMHPWEGDRLVPSLLAGHLPGRMGKGESSVSMSCRARCNIGHTGEENTPFHSNQTQQH